MADQSEFLIKIRTLLEDSGVKLTDEQFEKLSKTLSQNKKGAEEAGVSHKDLHESLKLVAIGAGDALGPIGELAHFLSNPYLLAAAGATLAIKELVEQHEKLIENIKMNIEKTREMRDALRDNFETAFRESAAAMADFHRQFAAVGQDIDQVERSMKSAVAAIHAQGEATRDLAGANRELQEVLLAGRQLQGQSTGVEGNFEAEQIKRNERAAREAAEHRQAADELTAKARAAEGHETAGSAAAGRADAERDNNRILDTSVKDAEFKLEQAKKTLAEADKKRTDAELESDGPFHQKRQDVAEAIRQQNAAQDQLRISQEHLARQEESKKDSDAIIERNQKEAISHREKAAAIREEITAQAALTAAKERAQAQIDATHDAATLAGHLNELERGRQAGTLTPEQSAEIGGINTPARDIGQAIRDSNRTISEIAQRGRINGGLSQEDGQQLVELNAALVGLVEGHANIIPTFRTQIEQDRNRIKALEDQARNNRPPGS
jgi:hypothetical protein